MSKRGYIARQGDPSILTLKCVQHFFKTTSKRIFLLHSTTKSVTGKGKRAEPSRISTTRSIGALRDRCSPRIERSRSAFHGVDGVPDSISLKK